jgi:2-polyprenyl-3-methyl-5-hydroxy-6-metoxy-1,4-benzoquinol methylase
MSYLAAALFPFAPYVPAEFYRRWNIDGADLGYEQADFPDLPQVNGQHDVVVSNPTLEHVEDVPWLRRLLNWCQPEAG